MTNSDIDVPLIDWQAPTADESDAILRRILDDIKAENDAQARYLADAQQALADGKPLPRRLHNILHRVHHGEVARIDGLDVLYVDWETDVARAAGWVEPAYGDLAPQLTPFGEEALRQSEAAVEQQSAPVARGRLLVLAVLHVVLVAIYFAAGLVFASVL